MEIGVIGVQTPTVAWERVRSVLAHDLGEIVSGENRALAAGLLRRTASVRCPCSRSALLDGATDALESLAPSEIGSRVAIDTALDDLLASGDLLSNESPDGRWIIYLGPPRYISRQNSILLMGGWPDIGLQLPVDLVEHLQSYGGYRVLRTPERREAEQALDEAGFFSYPLGAWTEAPAERSASDLIAEMDAELAQAGRSGEIPELLVLDHGRSPTHYGRRWVSATTLSGRYVARRPQKWGAPLWCYVQVEDGQVTRLVDLPRLDRRFRGCDEAWWLQFAIDAQLGTPQVVGVSPTLENRQTLNLNMPLPMWAERRLLVLAELTPERPSGWLFAYSVESDEVGEEIDFLQSRLWSNVEKLPAA